MAGRIDPAAFRADTPAVTQPAPMHPEGFTPAALVGEVRTATQPAPMPPEGFAATAVHGEALGGMPFSPAQDAEWNRRLLLLLAEQMRRRTQGDSASVRVEEAAELMESIRYTLAFYVQTQRLSPADALVEEPRAQFARAQRKLLDVLAQTRRLYDAALAAVQPLGSQSLQGTLRGLGVFFTCYDARLYAHRIHADMDYPLCLPVPDAPAGVLWVQTYLLRLLTENALLTRLEPARVARLMARVCPEYRTLPINLYEPVAFNATGLALLGGGETLAELTLAQAEHVRDMLTALPREAAQAQLTLAARRACLRLGLATEADARYLALAAQAMLPRLHASPAAVRGVFAPCETLAV